jgi:hypothetical protein
MISLDEIHHRWVNKCENDSVVPESLRNYVSTAAITSSYSSISTSKNVLSKNSKPHDGAIAKLNGTNDQQAFQSNTITPSFINQRPLVEMPKALEYRNFIEFPRLQDDIRMKLLTALK